MEGNMASTAHTDSHLLISLLKNHSPGVQQWGRITSSSLVLSSRQFYTRDMVVMVVGLTVLFLSSSFGILALPPGPSMQQVLWIVLRFVQTFVAVSLCAQIAVQQVIGKRSNSCCRVGACCRQMGKNENKLRKQVQRSPCHVQTKKCDERPSENLHKDNNRLPTGTSQLPNEENNMKLTEHTSHARITGPSKASPVQEPDHVTGSQNLSNTSSSGTVAPANVDHDVKQGSSPDQGSENLSDAQTSSGSQIKKNAISSSKRFRKGHNNKKKQTKKISSSFFRKSLKQSQSVLCQLKSRKLEQKLEENLKQNLEELKETEGKARDKNDVTKDLSSILSVNFTPKSQGQVYCCSGTNAGCHGDGGEQFWSEKTRLASFAMHAAVPSGVWLTQLAAEGFYCPDYGHSFVRCAFCQLDVDISQFRNRTPRELHSTMSPACPLLNGQANNTTLDQHRQTISSQFIQSVFGSGACLLPHTHQPENLLTLNNQSYERFGADANQGTVFSSSSLPSEPRPQMHAQRHDSSSEQTSAGHQLTADGDSRGSNFCLMPPSTTYSSGRPSAALQSITVPSHLPLSSGPERSATNESVPPAQQTGQTQEPAPNEEPARLVEPQTSELAVPQPPSFLSGAQTTETTSVYQTARPAETPQQGTPPGSSNTDAGSEQSQTSPSENESVRQLVTYAQLGIYTQEPKRPDLAVASSRINTYTTWPHSSTHAPEDMAQAGFYYVGTSDLVRCFYCKGGLKSWATSLRPWLEHARFYPKCPFVGQVKGQEFIDVVQDLKDKQAELSEERVMEELTKRQSATSDQGKQGKGALDGASGGVEQRAGAGAAITDDDVKDENSIPLDQAAEELEDENEEYRNERMCKICQVEEVSILFLPCGHLAACSQCAPALRTCAICRQRVKGRVRVLDDAGDYKYAETECDPQKTIKA